MNSRLIPQLPHLRLTADQVAATDHALDEALDRIAELSRRLWQVRGEHRPGRSGARRRAACRGCGQRYPCRTVLALDPGRGSASVSIERTGAASCSLRRADP